MTGLAHQALGLLMALALAPLAAGWIGKTRALLVGKAGVSVLQPYRDLAKLARKEPLVPEGAGPFLLLAPALSSAFVLTAAMLVPTFSLNLPLADLADVVVVFGLLAASRLSEALASLDAEAAWARLGASRRLGRFVFAEPAAMLTAFAFAALANSTALVDISGYAIAGGAGLGAPLALGAVALLAVAVLDCERGPFGSGIGLAETEATSRSLDQAVSGRSAALLKLAGMARVWIYVALAIAMFAPWGIDAGSGAQWSLAPALGAFLAKALAACTLLGVIEAVAARAKPDRAISLARIALAVSFTAAIVVCAGLTG